MKKYINLILGCGFLFAFILLIALLNVDKGVIAESLDSVGLSSLNDIVEYKYNETLDKMSDIIFYFSFVVLLSLVVVGIYELIKNKSLFKIDKYIIVFGVFVVLSIILWIFFDKVIEINIRPTHEMESSFPSTHVFVSTFFILGGLYYLSSKLKNNIIKYVLLATSILLIIVVSILRIKSGMHYITDVCGGIFLGLSLYFISVGITNLVDKDNKTEE